MNTCVCMKSLVDPFIYTLRMKEIRLAFAKWCEAISGRRSDRYHHRRQNTTSTLASTTLNRGHTHRGRHLSSSSPNGSQKASLKNGGNDESGATIGQQTVLIGNKMVISGNDSQTNRC